MDSIQERPTARTNGRRAKRTHLFYHYLAAIVDIDAFIGRPAIEASAVEGEPYTMEGIENPRLLRWGFQIRINDARGIIAEVEHDAVDVAVSKQQKRVFLVFFLFLLFFFID